ncbi:MULTISPECIES: heavy metal sensor histidine kinase [Pseudomonas]|jgi:two-component system heavy metal sensor histidine kinase CusS|uniref:Sensor protein n=2 Tax=Pseudomonas TaxID=286 RepID=A0A1H1IWR8_9PSED|nr:MULTISPECIES: heavy metal sensor histidine kinase [Pseudomonas]MBC8785441.1 heavy metal sensor histidine kinase [Pseudomonas fluorescens]MBJ2256928.1 heavy metal sensor histidine kinase [Pseudomonas psychrophila]MEB0207414.1 heavy metal sensor histidine kinase [Pseudomonas sp. CCC3.1]MQT63444.1 heavy metal sensor histidine kinase [Pseudomonas sp. FSL R10-0056]MQT67219.1 heavy metal sensor histidine kinase [Pseudomonas sp. FSL R10-0071]
MRPFSLAVKVGFKVGLMSAALLLLFATFGYLMVSQALERNARTDLEVKMAGMAHNLSAITAISGVNADAHQLVDLVMGHNNLYVSIFESTQTLTPLLSIGSKQVNMEVHKFQPTEQAEQREWRDSTGRPLMSASRVMRLGDGTEVSVFMTMDQSSNHALLDALLTWALMVSPLILMLILAIGWWTVRRGLLPLTKFLKVASRISTESLEHRLPTKGMPAELKNLADGINIMLMRLDDGVQQLSQFSDDLAHELRAPLSNLMGKAQVALTRERSLPEYREVLESCTEELHRMSRMVSDMLFLAQVSHPASMVEFESVSLIDETQRVCDLFSISAEEGEIQLQIAGSGDVVHGNQIMIQRAVSNLVSNAIRYCPRGRTVYVKVQRGADGATLSVGNPGRGIAKEHHAHLFERFYRVDKSRARSEGGTGLGLAIVQSIMILHQGSASVEVTDQNFTWFHLNFPEVQMKQQEMKPA